MLLTAAGGQCIRFAVPEVRVFAGRTSMGVRGINLEEGDKVISLSILRHVEATADERAAYLKRASAVRRGEEGEEGAADAEEAGSDAIELGEQRYVEMSEAEQFVLTVSENGMGKRSSSYQYRTTGRGGKGIVAMAITPKTGKLVASFPVEGADQIMLVTNSGQLIRTRVDGIRIAGRSTQGVIVFDTADDERVVSVEQLTEEGEENGGLMSIELYLVFVVATALLIATPGPNVALIVGTSLTHGARTGLIAMAGVNLGVMVQLVVVAAGLSWIVDLFAKNFDLIRFVGAAYLLFLGIQTLWKARKPSRAPASRCRANAPSRAGLRSRSPIPKTLIFQAAFLPQFLTNGEGRQAQLWLLAATFWIITVVGDAIWVLVRGAAQAPRVRPRATDRRSRLRRHPDRGRRRAAGGEPALIPGCAPRQHVQRGKSAALQPGDVGLRKLADKQITGVPHLRGTACALHRVPDHTSRPPPPGSAPSRRSRAPFACPSGVTPWRSAMFTFAPAFTSASSVSVCFLPPLPSTIDSISAVQPRLLT